MRRWMLIVTLLMFGLPTLIPLAQDTACDGLLTPRLVAGERGYVAPLGANNVRSAPSASAELVGQVEEGERFAVVDGPTCADGFVWFNIQNDRIEGWSAEGGGDAYWLLPLPANAIDPTTFTLTLEKTLSCGVEAEYGNNFAHFSTDGTRLAVDCGNTIHPVAVIDLATGAVTLSQNQSNMRGGDALADITYFVGDDSHIFATHGYSFRVYDATTMEETAMLETPVTHFPVVLSPDRSVVFHRGIENSAVIEIRDPVTLNLLGTIEDAVMTDVYDITLSDDMHTLIAHISNNGLGNGDSLVFERNGDSLTYTRIAQIPYSVNAISPDGTTFVQAVCTDANHGCQRNAVFWYDATTYQRLLEDNDVRGFVMRGVHFMPDSTAFMVRGQNVMTFYDTRSGLRLNEIELDAEYITLDLNTRQLAARSGTRSSDIVLYSYR